MKRLLALILVLTMAFSIATPAMAAPYGATNKEVTISGSPAHNNKDGVYIANDTWNNDPSVVWGTGANAKVALPGDQFHMGQDWLDYVFNPAEFPNIRYHADGFPMRAGHRTVVDHMGELRYLAQTYPEITKLHLLGFTQGIKDDVRNTNIFGNLFDERDGETRKVPVYALEICNAPGVQDGRPTTLHQAANHGGELEACEMAMNLAWYLTSQYGKTDTDMHKRVTELLDTTRVFILPYTNPEGSIAMMRNGGTGVQGRQTGWASDPNRNWAYRWGSLNGSGNGATGRGRGPGSDPEGQNVTSLYRSNQVISSISGHTNGQIIIYAWSSFYNPEDAHPMLTKLAMEQAAINGNTPQNGNVMYAQSGEINDYLWGAMRAMGFTYEYGQIRPLPYVGTLNGENYLITSYDVAAGIDRPIRVAAYSSAAGAGKPASDLTAKLVWMDASKHNGVPVQFDEFISVGYQFVSKTDPDNGLGKDGKNPEAVGSFLRQITPALVDQWLSANPGVVEGKIFVSHFSTNASRGAINTAADGNAIAASLKAAGAVGWMISGTGNRGDGGSYSQVSPNYGASGFPVFSLVKGYTRDIFDNAKADENVTITLKADTRDVLSIYYEWERQIPAYMRNMEYAREYANELSGTITNGSGEKLDNATLEASLVIESLVVDVDSSYQDAELIVPRSFSQQSKEMQRSTYDVVGGDYNWFMLPSKQTEYADKGWTVTAKAPGRYLDVKNVRFPLGEKSGIALDTDSAIVKANPLFQQKLTDVNFDLPEAIIVDQDLNDLLGGTKTVTFTTLNKDGEAADVVGVFVKVNGKNVDVENTATGKFTATFSGAETIEVGFPGAEALTAGDFTSDLPLREEIMELADVELRTDCNGVIAKGDDFGMKTSFVKNIPTNVVRLTYNYNPDLFAADVATSQENFKAAGFNVLDVKEADGQVQYTLMNEDQSYGMKRFYNVSLKERFYITNEDGTKSPTYDSSIGEWWTARQNSTEAYTNDLSELKKRVDGEPWDYYGENIVDPAVNADGTIDTSKKLGSRSTGDFVRFWDLDQEFTDATFVAKSDVDFTNGFQTITVVADYVDGDIDVVGTGDDAHIVLKNDTKVDKQSKIAMATFTTSSNPKDTFDLVFLSNVIDGYGKTASDPDWNTIYIFFDFVKNDTIDILDIVYVALRIR